MSDKYMQRVYTGNKEKNGYDYVWNSSHPDLEPTEIFSFGYSQTYCVYCCSLAKPIQAGLRDRGEDYTVTGYTCTCEGAESEKLLRKEMDQLKKKHEKEVHEVKLKFAPLLKHDKRKKLEMKYEKELKELEREETWEKRNKIH